MSIESLFTANIPKYTALQPEAGQGALGGKLTAEGLSFVDLILANFAEQAKKDKNAENGAGILQSDNSLLEKNPKLDIVALLAENPEIKEEIENYSLSEKTDLTKVLALNKIAFDEILKSLSDEGTTENIKIDQKVLTRSPAPIRSLFETFLFEVESPDEGVPVAELKEFLNNLRQSTEKDVHLLISKNITPAQLSAFEIRLENIIRAQNNQEHTRPVGFDENTEPQKAKSLIAILLKIVAPEEQDEAVAAAPENSVIASAIKEDGAQKAVIQNANSPALPESAVINKETQPSSGNAFTQEPAAPADNTKGEDKPAKEKNEEKSVQAPRNNNTLALIQNTPENEANPLFKDLIASHEELAVSASNNAGNSLTSLTNVVTQAQSASQPHPATQIVLAKIEKAATDGTAKNFTIQMDPPELGRVEVRMHFTEKNTLKLDLIIEKPETYAMLQRDSHLLERTMQNIGLDIDGSASFELAQDQNAFSQNGRHDHGRHGGTNSQDNMAEQTEIIESTMNWYVNPETGHMHYNILA